MPTPDEDLFDFLLSRWDQTAPADRARAWREIIREIAVAFRGRDGKAAFLGAFIGAARYDNDNERRELLGIARKALAEDDAAEEEAGDDDEHGGGVSGRELKQKRKAARDERDATLKRLNEQFCIVNEGGKAWIFADRYDEMLERHFYERIKQSDFMLLLGRQKVCVAVTDEGKAKYQSVARWWLNHPQAREYLNGVALKPAGATADGVLNLWRGFGFDPVPGSWERLKDHIRIVVCAGREDAFRYLMGWMARLVQFPGEPGQVAIVMRGKPGSGKGILGHALRKLFGHHGMHVNQSDHLTGKFNAHLRDCVLLFADEAFFVGDKAGMRALRALITENIKTTEIKNGAVMQVPNMLHLVMASNDDWVVPVIPGERRIAAFDVLDTRKGDYAYFRAIIDELQHGGYAAMLHELLSYDLNGFDVRDIPETEVLREQREFTLTPIQAWWREVLERGYVYRSEIGLEEKLHVWQVDVATELLYASYRQHVRERRERMEQRGTVLKFLCEDLKCQKTQVRNLIVGERMVGRSPEVVRSAFPRTVRVGTLPDARSAFERLLGIEMSSWPEPAEGADDVVVPLRGALSRPDIDDIPF